MTREQITELKGTGRVISLDNNQFGLFRHKDLKEVKSVRWKAQESELQVDSSDIQEFDDTIDLSESNIININQDDPRHERLFELDVDRTNQKVRLLELYSENLNGLRFTITDNQ